MKKISISNYLQTIDRSILDFDKEKTCCKTLSTTQIYCCLVCGKYYQGKSIGTPAYNHSLEENHHIFMSLTGKNIYELPKGNIVTSPSHSDIINSYDPMYTEIDIQSLDKLIEQSEMKDTIYKDYCKKEYIPGFIGFNRIGKTDGINCIIQSIGHCSMIRNILLQKQQIEELESQMKYVEFVKKMSLLIRKQWNKTALKALITPFELTSELQRIKKSFSIDIQGDLIEYFMFFLHALSPITQSFQSKLQIIENDKQTVKNCLCIPLDLPPMPLYPDHLKEKIIPHILLSDLLIKYDGNTETIIQKKSMKYSFVELPMYLAFTIKRFEHNTMQGEKNITIVEFEEKIDMKSYCSDGEKKDIQTQYQLVSCIKHDGGVSDGHYSCYVKNKSRNEWYLMDDENVSLEVFPMIKVSCVSLLIYERIV